MRKCGEHAQMCMWSHLFYTWPINVHMMARRGRKIRPMAPGNSSWRRAPRKARFHCRQALVQGTHSDVQHLNCLKLNTFQLWRCGHKERNATCGMNVKSLRLLRLSDLMEHLIHLELQRRNLAWQLTFHFGNEALAQPRKKFFHAFFSRVPEAPLQIIWVDLCNLTKSFPHMFLAEVDAAIILWREHLNRLPQRILCLIEPLQPTFRLQYVRPQLGFSPCACESEADADAECATPPLAAPSPSQSPPAVAVAPSQAPPH